MVGTPWDVAPVPAAYGAHLVIASRDGSGWKLAIRPMAVKCVLSIKTRLSVGSGLGLRNTVLVLKIS